MNDYILTTVFNYLYIIINILTGFILFPLIIKYLGYSVLGVFGILFSFKSVIDIAISWFSSSITKALLKYNYLEDNVITLSFIINIIYGVCSFFIFLLYGYLFQISYIYSTLYFGIFVFFSFLTVTYFQILISKLKQYQVALFKVIQQSIFSIGAIGFFIIEDKKSLDIIFLMLAISSIITFIIVYIYFNKNYTLKFVTKKINKSFFKSLIISNGTEYFFNSATTIILLQIDILLISYLYGNKAGGIYLIVWKIPNTMIMLGWRLSEPFYAIVGKNLKTNRTIVLKQFYSLEKRILVLSIIGAIIYIFLGKLILDLWLNGKDIPSIPYMYLIPAVVVVFSIMQRLYLSGNYYAKGLNTVSKLQLFEILMKIIFIVFFFDYFNVLAPIVGWFVAFLFTMYFYRRNSIKVLNG